MTVDDAREIMIQREVDKLETARRLVEAAYKLKTSIKWFKKARKWRLDHILELIELLEAGGPKRLVRRG